MNSRDSSSSRTHTTTSEFTEHAALLLKQYYRESWFGHNDDATSPLSELCEQLNPKSYELLKCEIHKTFPQCDIMNIHCINAPQMYGMYLLRKAEMRLQANGGNDVEEVLYHVTAESNAVESLISGLDWRRNQRPRFGSGVSFSNNVDYSNYYANQSTNKEGTRVIIISTVLINDTHVVTEKWFPKISLIIPPGTADTTVSPNGHVFVKYNDFESYPMFFVYYRWSPELRNESKFYVTNNNKLQKSQQQEELQTLCQQVADICIGAEPISIATAAAAAKAKAKAKAKSAAIAKAKAVDAAKVAAAAKVKAAIKAKVAAAAEAEAVAAAKVLAAVASATATKAATPQQKRLSKNKTAIKHREYRRRRAEAKAEAAEVDAAATKLKATAIAKAATKAKVAATAAAKVAAAAKAVAVTKVAAAAKAKAVAAAAEAKSVAAATKTAAAATPKQLSQKKSAIKSRERRRRRAEAKAEAAEVDATARSMMTPRRQ